MRSWKFSFPTSLVYIDDWREMSILSISSIRVFAIKALLFFTYSTKLDLSNVFMALLHLRLKRSLNLLRMPCQSISNTRSRSLKLLIKTNLS